MVSPFFFSATFNSSFFNPPQTKFSMHLDGCTCSPHFFFPFSPFSSFCFWPLSRSDLFSSFPEFSILAPAPPSSSLSKIHPYFSPGSPFFLPLSFLFLLFFFLAHSSLLTFFFLLPISSQLSPLFSLSPFFFYSFGSFTYKKKNSSFPPKHASPLQKKQKRSFPHRKKEIIVSSFKNNLLLLSFSHFLFLFFLNFIF